MQRIEFEQIVSQLKSELNAQCAIANKYGIILASLINEFAKGKIIPQKILELISSASEIANELNLNRINSFAIEALEYNYLFTFSEDLILISKLDLNVNLAKFMPSVSVFLKSLSLSSKKQEVKEFSNFDFSKEISKIEEALIIEKLKESKYSIIKDLIKFISN